MKNFLCSISLLLAFTFLTGCPNPTPKNPTFYLGKPFNIAQGQTMQTADNALTIHFDEVSGDSRCPTGVQCIWAGRADCIFTLSKGSATQTITLSSGDFSQGGSAEAAFSGYTITLNDLSPPKPASGGIAQKDYVARVTVK
jgi:hypothetical protein